MRIAYLISAYTDPVQLGRTIAALADRDTAFFIHIDARVEESPFRNSVPDSAAGQTVFLKKRFRVNWGGYSQVRYQTALLEACLSCGREFDRVIIISGQDYPLSGRDGIQNTLQEAGNREFITGLDISRLEGNSRIRSKIVDYHFFTDIRHFPRIVKKTVRFLLDATGIKKKPYVEVRGSRWDVFQSSSYMCISSDLAKYILETFRNEKSVRRYFRFAYIPEELLIPTIVFNSPFRDRCTIYPDRYDGLKTLSALTYFNYGEKIQVFSTEDYDELTASGKLFARKFATGISDRLIERLESDLSVKY